MLWKRLRALLGASHSELDLDLVRAEIVALRGNLEAVREKLRELDELQLKRELEWSDTRQRLLRYLQRISAVEQRQREREEEQSDQGGAKPSVRSILAAKFPQVNGG